MPNSEIVDRIDSSDEWIRERSGIISRRFAAPDEIVIDMAEAAARAGPRPPPGSTPSQIGAILLATVTHPYQTPGGGPDARDRLGMTRARRSTSPPPAPATATASRWPTTWSAAARPSTSSSIGVEKLSDFTDPDDRGIAFIFGDGAGAAVVGPSDTPGIGPTVWGSDGAQWKAISQREPWIDVRERQTASRAAGRRSAWQGQTVFRWAVWGMAPVAQQALDAAGVKADDLDAFIPHQANMRIIDAMIKQLKLPADIPVARDIAETANTSAASIPLATERMLRRGRGPAAAASPCRSASAPGWSTPRRSSSCPDTLPRARRVTRASTTAQHDPRRHQGAHPWRRASRRSSRVWPRSSTRRPVSTPPRSSSDKSFTDDLDIDSLSMMTIVVNAEEKFGVRIPDDEVKNLKTVRDAVTFIAKRAGLTARRTLPRVARPPHRGAGRRRQSAPGPAVPRTARAAPPHTADLQPH